MIYRYDFGTPIHTGAVVQDLPVSTGAMTYMTVSREGEKVRFSTPLDPEDLIFGLGESVRGINKRGHRYRAWNSDDFSHTENKASLYGSHNFLLFFGPKGAFGVYFDDPGAVDFDLGFTRGDEAVITSQNGNLSVYVVEGDGLRDVAKQFRQLIGRSYVPPRWAMGYLQSRWGYSSDTELRTIVREHRQRHIPLDGVCMDIDYMDHFKDFSWNKENFPDLKALTTALAADHIHLIPIMDAGVKLEEGDPVFDEGMAKDYFVRKENGELFVGAVWPGRACFPDFLRSEVRTWFGRCYRPLLEAGVTAFWNDMNEPAIFYSLDGLAEAYQVADALRGRELHEDESFALKDAFNGLSNSMADYCRFYHVVDGKRIRHDQVHNLYGAMMTKATAEGLRAFEPKKRHLIFSRSSFIGAHRDGGVWQGDNSSWWSHILLNLKMLPNLNLCGFLFTGADLGGFSCDTTEDLLLRWLQLGVFTPLMRNHSAQHTRDQEIYRFRNWQDMRNVLTVRYALIPYLYSELMKAAYRDELMFRPLAFDYPQDVTACRVEDQVLLGGECMIAPVYEQNARGRHVYLPEDMLLVRFRSAEDFDLLPMNRGHHWVELGMAEFPLFIRCGHFIPLVRSAEDTTALDTAQLRLLGWVDEAASYALYEDDGESAEVDLDAGMRNIAVCASAEDVRAQAEGKTLDVSGIIVS